MARYFFDTDDGQDFVQDETGHRYLTNLIDVREPPPRHWWGCCGRPIWRPKFSVVVRDANGLVFDAHANFGSHDRRTVIHHPPHAKLSGSPPSGHSMLMSWPTPERVM